MVIDSQLQSQVCKIWRVQEVGCWIIIIKIHFLISRCKESFHAGSSISIIFVYSLHRSNSDSLLLWSTCRHPNQAAAVEEPWYINTFFPERLPHGWALLLVGRPSLRPGVTTASGSMPFERPIKVTDRSWPNLSTRGAEHRAHNELQCLEVKSYISLLTVYFFSPPWLTFVKSLFSVQSCKHCVCMTHLMYVNMTNS